MRGKKIHLIAIDGILHAVNYLMQINDRRMKGQLRIMFDNSSSLHGAEIQ